VEYQTFTSEYVQRLADGDREVERHFAAYFDELLLIKLRRSLRCFHAIEDVRQETLVRVFKVLRSRGGLVNPEKLGAFVNGVCNNVLAEHYRATSRFSALPQPGVEAQTPEPDPEEGLVSEERKRSVRQILDKLPAKDRRILHLMFIEEREKDEVCRICRVNRNYLRVLLHRAKNRFRDSLDSVSNNVSNDVSAPPQVTSIASFRTAAAPAFTGAR
jgi:RNA polymerase sigma-70 factor (ECF subfamily)